MSKKDLDYFNELFTSSNKACEWYAHHRERLTELMDGRYHTLPIAAAYNAGYEEASKKIRNLTCHTLQTKKD